MLKLKLQSFAYLMRRTGSLEKTLMLGKIGGRRIRGQQRVKWLNGITDLMNMSLSKLLKFVLDREAWSAGVQWIAKSQIQLSDWTELNWILTILLTKRRWRVTASVFLKSVRPFRRAFAMLLILFHIHLIGLTIRTMRTQMSLHSNNTNHSGIFTAPVTACNSQL